MPINNLCLGYRYKLNQLRWAMKRTPGYASPTFARCEFTQPMAHLIAKICIHSTYQIDGESINLPLQCWIALTRQVLWITLSALRWSHAPSYCCHPLHGHPLLGEIYPDPGWMHPRNSSPLSAAARRDGWLYRICLWHSRVSIIYQQTSEFELKWWNSSINMNCREWASPPDIRHGGVLHVSNLPEPISVWLREVLRDFGAVTCIYQLIKLRQWISLVNSSPCKFVTQSGDSGLPCDKPSPPHHSLHLNVSSCVGTLDLCGGVFHCPRARNVCPLKLSRVTYSPWALNRSDLWVHVPTFAAPQQRIFQTNRVGYLGKFYTSANPSRDQ